MQYSETELVSELKKQNAKAYEHMVREYAKPVYFLACRILRQCANKEDIEECVSDVFLDAWFKIHEFDAQKSSLKTWLLMLTKYKSLTYRRKFGKEGPLNIDDFQPEDPATTEKQVICRENQETIINTINTFNKTDKELFIRRYFFGEGINDLMDSLNLSRSAIDNRLLRGRKLIKEAIYSE